jgi:hypothetical protein
MGGNNSQVHWQVHWQFLDFVNARGCNLLKLFSIFCGYVIAWGQEVRSFYILWSYWCVGATIQKFHDLCDYVDVWRQQPINILLFLWLCVMSCLKLFVLCCCANMGRTNKNILVASCENDMNPLQKPTLRK